MANFGLKSSIDLNLGSPIPEGMKKVRQGGRWLIMPESCSGMFHITDVFTVIRLVWNPLRSRDDQISDETLSMALDYNGKWYIKREYHKPMLDLGYKSDEHYRELTDKNEMAELLNTNAGFRRWYKHFKQLLG